MPNRNKVITELITDAINRIDYLRNSDEVRDLDLGAIKELLRDARGMVNAQIKESVS